MGGCYNRYCWGFNRLGVDGWLLVDLDEAALEKVLWAGCESIHGDDGGAPPDHSLAPSTPHLLHIPPPFQVLGVDDAKARTAIMERLKG